MVNGSFSNYVQTVRSSFDQMEHVYRASDAKRSLPEPPPQEFGPTEHIVNVFENNVTKTNYFTFNCPYNAPNITITHIFYKIQSNSSNFNVTFYNSNYSRYDPKDPEHTNNTYWQLIFNQCSYYCEGNYTLQFNASQCFIFSSLESFNETLLISYEIIEEYVDLLPSPTVESPPPAPENPNPPSNQSDGTKLGAGAIAGIVIGCLAFIGILVGVTVYFVRKYDMFNQNVAVN